MDFNIVLFTDKSPLELGQWFAYHKVHGCTKFYVYNNSDIYTKRHMYWKGVRYERYLEMFNIEYVEMPGKLNQMKAYNKFIQLKTDVKCFVLDDDEYLVPFHAPVENRPTVAAVLDHVTTINYQPYKIYWKLFGSSGHDLGTASSVIETFLWSQKGLDTHYKSMFTPLHAISMLDPHTVEVSDSYPLIPLTTLYIAHYHTKSKSEYRAKCYTPRADTGERRDFETSFPAHDRNEVFNSDVAYWGKAVRELLLKEIICT